MTDADRPALRPEPTGLGRVAGALEAVPAIDRIADPLHRLLSSKLPDGLAGVLQGEWLGHPLHPLLTDLPIGFWTSAWVLDIVGGERAEPAADALLGLGVLGAVPTLASGWADWIRLPRSGRRVGVVHAASNAVATGLFAASWRARRHGDRGRGVLLCHAGAAVATVGGFLGGHLAFETPPVEDAREDRAPRPSVASGAEDEPTEHDQVAGVPSDNTTLTSILADLQRAGFGADFRPTGDGGEVRCGACGTTSPVGSFADLVERRLEGASDPDDMMLVVAGRCPRCHEGGVMTLSYGPAAGESDSAVVAALP